MGNDDKWYVHVVGPDDVIEQVSEMDALRLANTINVGIEREQCLHGDNPNHPYSIALVVKNYKWD
jgi:hypothetical protein